MDLSTRRVAAPANFLIVPLLFLSTYFTSIAALCDENVSYFYKRQMLESYTADIAYVFFWQESCKIFGLARVDSTVLLPEPQNERWTLRKNP